MSVSVFSPAVHDLSLQRQVGVDLVLHRRLLLRAELGLLQALLEVLQQRKQGHDKTHLDELMSIIKCCQQSAVNTSTVAYLVAMSQQIFVTIVNISPVVVAAVLSHGVIHELLVAVLVAGPCPSPPAAILLPELLVKV
jgi:hypothetical protein